MHAPAILKTSQRRWIRPWRSNANAVRAGYSWDGTLTGEKGGAISANREKKPTQGWRELTIRHPRSAHAVKRHPELTP